MIDRPINLLKHLFGLRPKFGFDIRQAQRLEGLTRGIGLVFHQLRLGE